ncbi:two-component system CitB family sensor kinase [Brevibacterium sanguinis]|uniref:histidine kinase n=2 Tax=Brevibacterium TaxID=1696 RepID=A0A366IH61_9MICO|nr:MULTISPECIES: sensor histidine kinase [Brevibacterium]RBP64930.1 two-component system CitB family sensor kinase [Brevibacterium sanguinis]RBP71193.1 two-component system CitB family sensor kinase [Brevibacterium celere]
MTRSAGSFSRRVLLSQLAVVIVMLVLVTAVFGWMGARNVTDVTETEALSTARSLAIAPTVREGATRASQERAAQPDPAITEPLQDMADDLRDRSGIEFAVITDDRGIRLTHPDPEKVGKMVSTSPAEALAGRESVTHARGTLGTTVRAKVPIYSTAEDGTVVGEVSVGIHTSVLAADLRREFLALGSVAVLALGLGVLASVALGRRLRRETLGVGPEELAEMARDQGAVLHGLDDGVLGFDLTGEVTLSNSVANRLLDTEPALGGADGSAPELPQVPESIHRLMAEAPERGALRRRLTVGDRILLATAVRVKHGDVSVGGVVTLRDETQMLTMAQQLESVTTMAQALRAQRHEFANRLHTALGLVDTGATEEARSYLATILRTGPIATPVEGIELITDPYLSALLEAKGTTAAEAGVRLIVTSDSLVLGRVTDPEDVTLILGNLIDNAVRAVVQADVQSTTQDRDHEGSVVDDRSSTVEVQLLSSGTELHVVVTDTGDGVAAEDAEQIFDEGVSGPLRKSASASERSARGSVAGDGHGLGIGLALCRRVARRHGGRVWLVDGHDANLGGASFGVRLPGVLTSTDADESILDGDHQPMSDTEDEFDDEERR